MRQATGSRVAVALRLGAALAFAAASGAEAGGLSGAPLFARATAVLAGMSARLRGEVPLVGVGGILAGADAAAEFAAGARLVQFYTGMIYVGPGLVADCVDALRPRLAGGPDPAR